MSHAFKVGQTVHTVEGIAGKITKLVPTGPLGSPDPHYLVDWEDGISDQQPESFFQESEELEDEE